MEDQHDFEMHDDDKPIGRLLTRREVLALLGGAMGTAVLAGTGLSKINIVQGVGGTATPTPNLTATATSIPACVVRPALTEGPYFVDNMLNRSDIRTEPDDEEKIVVEGTLLKLIFRVSQMNSSVCMPLAGAQVDIWHCDAKGVYSGVQDRRTDTSSENWLRGYQVTDENGIAEFYTIYPGWYPGRAVHIHFKIRTDPEATTGYEFTSQLFFPTEITEEAYQVEPYASRGTPNVPNENDNIFRGSDDLLTLAVVAYTDEEKEEDGYIATFDIALELEGSSTSSNRS